MTITDIIAGLQKFWDSNGPGITTVFPGTETEVSTEQTWAEFWATQLSTDVRRPTGPSRIDLSIDLHLFSKSFDTRAVFALADSAHATLQNVLIVIDSASNPGQPVGTVRVEEGTLRDLSRGESTGTSVRLQHLLLSFPATAQTRF